MHMLRIKALLTVERQKNEAEHIERSHKRGTQPHQPPQHTNPATFDRCTEDFVFAPESGKGWNAGNGNSRQQHGFVGAVNVVAQTTHTAHVLLLVHGMDDTAGPQKEQTLKKGMRHDMK